MSQKLIINLHTNIDQGNGNFINTIFNYNMLTTDPPPSIPVNATSDTPFFTNILNIATIDKLSDNFFFDIRIFKSVLNQNMPSRSNVPENKAIRAAKKSEIAEKNIMTTLEYLFPPPATKSWISLLTNTTSTIPIKKMTPFKSPKRMSYFHINGQDYTLIETKWKNDITNDTEIMKFIMKIYTYMKTTIKQQGRDLTVLENRLFTQLKGNDFMRITQKTQRNGPETDNIITKEADVTNLLRKMKKVLDGIRDMVVIVNDFQNRIYSNYSSVPYKVNPIPSIRILLQRFFIGGDITNEIVNKTRYNGDIIKVNEYAVYVNNYVGVGEKENNNIDLPNKSFIDTIASSENENGYPQNIIDLFKQIGETPDDDKKRKRILINYFISLFEDLTFLGQENNENYSFFSSKVPLLTSLYAMVKQIKDERHFSEDYVKNMIIIDPTTDKKLFDSAPKEYRDFITEINAIAGTLRLSNIELQQMMVDFAKGISTVSIMIPFLGFLIDNEYVRDDDDLVNNVRKGNGTVFKNDIFDSSNKYMAMFKRCVKSGYKTDASNNVVIDVYVDFIFGKFASADLPLCKIRGENLGSKLFNKDSAPSAEPDENKFLDQRLDPYLGSTHVAPPPRAPAVVGGRYRSRRRNNKHRRQNTTTIRRRRHSKNNT